MPIETEITVIDEAEDYLAIQVTWSQPADNGAPVTGYQLWMSEEEFSYKMVYDGTRRSDILKYTVTQGITKTLTYNFKVTAINFVGTSGFSSVLTSLAAVVPSVPLDFEITDSSLGGVSLTWTTPLNDGGDPLQGFYIYYRLTGTSDSWS
jgi:hypothetical protein